MIFERSLLLIIKYLKNKFMYRIDVNSFETNAKYIRFILQ